MIWPGRTLILATLVPALLSLALLVDTRLLPVVLAVDLVAVAVAGLDLLTLLGPSGLRVERRCGSVLSLAEPQEVELTLTNKGKRPQTALVRDDVPETFDASPAQFLVRLPARGEAVLKYKVTPRRRGTYAFERVDVLFSSRLGFWRRSLVREARTVVRVYPDLRQISRYTVLARRDRLSALGVRRSRQAGSDNEFERLRDYAEGDEPRHLDWRATARRRKLTVRTHQANQSQRLIFLIDCGRMMAGDTGGGLSPLDHAFNAMLMLAHVALLRGDQVGLLAFSDRVRAYVPPGGGAGRTNRLVHAVHNIFPELVEPRFDRAFLELDRRCRKRSLVVLMTNVMDEVNASAVSDHLGHAVGRHLPLGVFLRDADLFALADDAPEKGLGLYQGAAAAAMLNARELTLAGLRARGVLTLDLAPEALTAPLVNEYLQIKARHLL
jgi:uncharacterized protein (DUF58 family)